MDRNEYIEKLKSADTTINLPIRKLTVAETIDPDPIFIGKGTRNLIIVMEEFSELIEQYVNAENGNIDMVGLLEETADVEQSLDFVQIICNITDEELQFRKTTFDVPVAFPVVALSTSQKIVSKYLRGKASKSQMIDMILVVQSALSQIKFEYNISQEDINKSINVKTQRLYEYVACEKLYK